MKNEVLAGSYTIQQSSLRIETEVVYITKDRHHGRDAAPAGEQHDPLVISRVETELSKGARGLDGHPEGRSLRKEYGDTSAANALGRNLHIAGSRRRGADGVAASLLFSVEEKNECEELARQRVERLRPLHGEAKRFRIVGLFRDPH